MPKNTLVELDTLKKREKVLFDTYKQNRSNKEKIAHLREMADVIEKIDMLTT